MFHLRARYLDRDGNECSCADAYYTEIGTMRTRRDGPPLQLIDGEWREVVAAEAKPDRQPAPSPAVRVR